MPEPPTRKTGVAAPRATRVAMVRTCARVAWKRCSVQLRTPHHHAYVVEDIEATVE
jgi:hypothetical protein